MKSKKAIFTVLLCFLTIFSIIQPALGAYSVKTGAYFRWDATKYYFQKGEGGPGSDIEYTHEYTLEFNFTNWAEISGLYYINGTINNNGTILDGEISHEYYYSRQLVGQEWVTDILDYQGDYPVHVYLVCDTEIAQTTKPDLEDLATNSWLNFGEPSTNNFTLTGSLVEGDNTYEYVGKIEFNSDKVLKHVHDEMVQKNLGVTVLIERYIWDLTYTPGTGSLPNGTNGAIPGYSALLVISMLIVGIMIIIWKKKLIKLK